MPPLTKNQKIKFDAKRAALIEKLESGWYTLEELSHATNISILSISARVRDLRKAQYGGYDVPCRKRAGAPDGLNEYSIIPHAYTQAALFEVNT